MRNILIVAGGAVAVVARPEAHVTGAVHLADAEPRRLFARIAARFRAELHAALSPREAGA